MYVLRTAQVPGSGNDGGRQEQASPGVAVPLSAPGYGYGQKAMPKELLQSPKRCQESGCNN